MAEARTKAAEIWAVAGGKGGTGKSFVISNLALHLALQHFRTVLIDADFGGPNLHSYFGLRRPPRSLTDFFDRRSALGDLLNETPVPQLRLVPGNVGSLSPEGFPFAQKAKLYRHIKSLNADYVLLDLGGGTSFNTIDTFLLADKMLAVILPEVTAIENMYHFIKSIYFRKLKMLLGMHGLKHHAEEKWKARDRFGIRTLQDLIASLRTDGLPCSDVIEEELANFRVHIILNQVRGEEQIELGFSLKSICRKHLGIDAAFSGYIHFDTSFRRNGGLDHFCDHSRSSIQLADRVRTLIHHLQENRQLSPAGAP